MGQSVASGTRSLARRWGPWLLALLVLVLAWSLTRSVMRAARSLDRLPVHGEYLAPPEGFLHGAIGMREALGSLLDQQGVLLYDYGGDVGRQYNPLFIADFALALVPRWGEPEGKRLLRSNLDHLLATATATPGGYLAFPYTFDFPAADEVAPWYSAMAQARAGQALMWGWRLSGDRRYLEGAKSAILAMTDPGVSPPFAKPLARGVWLKEFPGNRYNVLDGSLVAVVGVHQVWKGLPEDDPDRERIRNLFEGALNGFKANQRCFTSPFGGVYFNDAGHAPTQSYYDIITTQLRYLSAIDTSVAEIANTYSLGDESWGKRLAYAWWLRVNRWWNKRGFPREPCVR
jgi:hypothetical protein